MDTFTSKQFIKLWKILLILVAVGSLTHKVVTEGARINLKVEFLNRIPKHLITDEFSTITISSEDILNAIQGDTLNFSNGLKAGYLPEHFDGFMTTYYPLFASNINKKTPYFLTNIMTHGEYGILKYYQPPKKEYSKLTLTLYPDYNGNYPVNIDITGFEQSSYPDSTVIYIPTNLLIAPGLDTANLLTPEQYKQSIELAKEHLNEALKNQ